MLLFLSPYDSLDLLLGQRGDGFVGVIENWGVTRKVKAEVRVYGGCGEAQGQPIRRQEVVKRKGNDDRTDRRRDGQQTDTGQRKRRRKVERKLKENDGVETDGGEDRQTGGGQTDRKRTDRQLCVSAVDRRLLQK